VNLYTGDVTCSLNCVESFFACSLVASICTLEAFSRFRAKFFLIITFALGSCTS